MGGSNGLLRDYPPKDTDRRVHSAIDLAMIESKLNARPRNTLAWRTHAEVFGLTA